MSALTTQVFTNTLGWIPGLPGLGVRYLLYRAILQKIGRSVKIYPNVGFTNAKTIAIGSGVVIHSRVFVDTVGQDHLIEIGDRVRLDPDVRLSCMGQRGKIKLAESVHLDRGVDLKVHQEGQVQIGKQTYIGPYTCISAYGKIAIGQDCLIASHTSIYAHNHNFSDPNRKIREQGFTVKGITIEDDCWLGSGVKVVDGVTIGKSSVISAGAVVMKDVPPYSVAAGVPAKIIAKRDNLSVI